LDNKHIFIVGESGSGKTVFLKNLAYELRKHDKTNRIILTDVQGDIIQLLLSDISDNLQAKGWQSRVSYQNAQEIKATLENYQLIIPARRGGNSDNVIALKKLAEQRGVKVREIGLRLQDLSRPSDVEYLFRVSSEQASMLLDEEAEIIQRNNSVTIGRLREALNRIVNGNNQQQVFSSAGTSYYKTTFYAALRALKSLEEYFDFHQPSLSVTNNPLDWFDFDGTTILYLDELDQDERVMWEMQLVRWLYLHKKDHWKAYVFFDEAHQIIPAKPSGGGSEGTFDRLRVNFERLAREGRKFGINLVLSTQNPKDLHPIVPEQCPTRIVMKINPRNANYAFLEPELATIANRFNHGQFWIQSPFNGTSNWVRVHSLTPPLPHEPMVHFWRKVVEKSRE
jgi:DNA helicase HerA-like ATPase